MAYQEPTVCGCRLVVADCCVAKEGRLQPSASEGAWHTSFVGMGTEALQEITCPISVVPRTTEAQTKL